MCARTNRHVESVRQRPTERETERSVEAWRKQGLQERVPNTRFDVSLKAPVLFKGCPRPAWSTSYAPRVFNAHDKDTHGVSLDFLGRGVLLNECCGPSPKAGGQALPGAGTEQIQVSEGQMRASDYPSQARPARSPPSSLPADNDHRAHSESVSHSAHMH